MSSWADGLSRRKFLASIAAAGVLASCSDNDGPDPNHVGDHFSRGPTPYKSEADPGAVNDTGPFHLKYAPHFGMFEDCAGTDLVDQLKFAADQGFRAWEDNFMPRRQPVDQERLASAMTSLNIEMGVIVLGDRRGWDQPTLTTSKPEATEAFLEQVRVTIECAKRVNAKWLTVLPGQQDKTLRRSYQTANVIDNLRRACDLLEPHGMMIALEAINTRVDFPNVFLDRTYDAHLICKAINRPSCKLLFDAYHQQIMDGSMTTDIDACWDQIVYFQFADHPGRNEPGTGEINFGNLLQHIYAKGYRGVVGMEHGVNDDGAEGERKMIARYRALDALLT